MFHSGSSFDTDSAPGEFATVAQAAILTPDRAWGEELVRELRWNGISTILPRDRASLVQDLGGAGLCCIVYDIDNAGSNARDGIADLAACMPRSLILVAASSPTLETMITAVWAGAYAVIDKHAHLSESIAQIESAVRGSGKDR